MQFIQGSSRHQTYFATLEDQVAADNPVRLIDAFSVVGVQSTEFFCYSTLHQQHEFKKTYYGWVVGENSYPWELKKFEHQRRNLSLINLSGVFLLARGRSAHMPLLCRPLADSFLFIEDYWEDTGKTELSGFFWRVLSDLYNALSKFTNKVIFTKPQVARA